MTRRELIDLLLHNPLTLSEIVRERRMSPEKVRDDLEHLERSLRHGPLTLRHLPPACRSCGFRFTRARLGRPGRCPGCRGTWIEEGRVLVERDPAPPHGKAGGGRRPS